MKLWILSDLHLEMMAYLEPPTPFPEHDVVVLAGDIDSPPASAIQWASTTFSKPVVYIAGNHEFYHRQLEVEIERGREAARRCGVHYLENDEVRIGNARFFGCTLWSDFALFGQDHVAKSMDVARTGLTDFHLIRSASGGAGERFTPEMAAALHAVSRAWLERNLPLAGSLVTEKIVVVTHNAPHPDSVQKRFVHDRLSPCFVNDMRPVFERHQIHIWIHGHCHAVCDYRVGRTRLIENSYGYGGEDERFDWHKVVEI